MIYLIISVIALLAIIMYDYSWSNVTNDTRNDIIFDGKNKAYGAYEMRRTYSRKTFFSLIGVMITLTAAIASPKMFTWENPKPDNKKALAALNEIEVIENPVEEVEIPKVEEMIETKVEEQPAVEMMQWIKPEASDVEQNDPAKTLADLENKNLGPKNKEGIDSIVEVVIYDPPKLPTDEILEISELQEQPEFTDLYPYLKNKMKYPREAVEMSIQGTVYVSFIVEKDGKVKVTGVKRGVHELLDEEAKRVVAAMPNWTPGKFNGKPVRVRMTLPVKFKLAQN